MSTITRDGATWELRSPGEHHYSARREGGHLFLHARKECSRLDDPVVVSPKIVRTLWEKDAASGTSADENDVQWCEKCATRRVDEASPGH